jgi:nitrous oxidase accessory protein NosD
LSSALGERGTRILNPLIIQNLQGLCQYDDIKIQNPQFIVQSISLQSGKADYDSGLFIPEALTISTIEPGGTSSGIKVDKIW